MKTMQQQNKIETSFDYKLLDIKDDKYLVKFSNIDVPVEMNEKFYRSLFDAKIE